MESRTFSGKESGGLDVSVGLVRASAICVDFVDRYVDGAGRIWSGRHAFTPDRVGEDGLTFRPLSDDSVFGIDDVVIGDGFHWERKECQFFHGRLVLRPEGDGLRAINVVDMERYLESVISSEMNPDASVELLKAHAVISRSWLVAQIGNAGAGEVSCGGMVDTPEERVRWYDHSQHSGFDVCADDHCQRYQGVTRILNRNAVEAVGQTRGEILTYEGKVCDARFSKCCGGAFETFGNCWQPVDKPYLRRGRDVADKDDSVLPDLTVEENAARWIMSSPDSFCNTDDQDALRQVLNDYDLSTRDFFRWKVTYSQEELSEIVRNRSGIDFGRVIDLVPVERGESGRLTRLRIIGTQRSMTIGKELEIRRTLSRTHLYSSAFIVEKTGSPVRFTFHGAGWGHGVGLCQIGAAMMAKEGYSYRHILSHYYPSSELKTLATSNPQNPLQLPKSLPSPKILLTIPPKPECN